MSEARRLATELMMDEMREAREMMGDMVERVDMILTGKVPEKLETSTIVRTTMAMQTLRRDHSLAAAYILLILISTVTNPSASAEKAINEGILTREEWDEIRED